MYARSNSMTLTVAEERFAFPTPVMARSTQPEVFTFERIPTPTTAVRSYVPIRPKRRCTRVMYPAKVRMHLPAPERSQAKRWLVILCLVVLWQIYTEEPCAEAPPSADCSISEYQGFTPLGLNNLPVSLSLDLEKLYCHFICRECIQNDISWHTAYDNVMRLHFK
uniref:Uncharacterized protein n=1 Tax=Fundulus heteroclitus TaxID=8078 RepID=A0A3Q2R1S1_FUNHE